MTAVDERPETEIGKPRRRKEDQHLITGRTTWTDNMSLPGMLHLAILRSPVAHATIVSIDTSEAARRPGVVAVFTGQDFAETQGNVPCAWPVTPDMINPGAPSLAVTQVNHVGEAVAVIAARDKVSAQDALEGIGVEYEQLPPVLDMEAAIAADATLVHPNTSSNRSYTWAFESGAAGTGAPIEDALVAAEVTVKRRFIQQRLIPAFMEPRSTVVQPVGEGVTVWSATQIPHILRTMLALTLGIAEQKVRVIAPDVGGGFGGKIPVTPEEIITTLVARRLGKPAKYTESRSESLMSAHHGRDQIQDITITARRDGTITGLDVHLLADMGAYLRLVGPGVPILGAFMYNAIYKIPAYRFVCEGIFTTKTPTDAYRGAGRPEATFAIERIMDELAAELDIDPMQLRRKNWITHEEFPYTTVCGLTYDSGNYEAATDKALELIGWDALRTEQAERRASNDPVQLGLGISTFTEMCGLAPSRVLGSLDYGAGGWENASVRMMATGTVQVVTGSSAHGQGHETAFSQIVADRLGVPFENVEILHGDTQSSPKGLDTYGSRSLAVGGIAIVKAADKVIAKARTIAAHLLEASADDLEFEDGSFQVKGSPGSSMSLGEVAFATFMAHNLPDGVEPSLDSDATYDPENFSFPHGTHLCAVDIDTETGRTTIRKYVCVDDVGTPINPLIVEGQVHGGLAQGIAQALFEEAVFDDAGNLTTGTFVDYTVPSAADLPSFTTDRTVTPATSNPLGVKGVGEAGTIASTPAVVNAIVDALRPFGVNDVRMPATPERVWRAIHGGSSSDRTTEGTTAYGGASTATSDGTGGVMIPAAFDYVRPDSIPSAVEAIAAAGEDGKVLAGGQSLIPVLRLRLAYPSRLVDIGRVAELSGVHDDGTAIVIGAMTTHHDILRNPLVAEHAPLIAQATATVADPQVRHRGTFGGALAHADPAGDLGAVALALECEFVAVGPSGERRIAAADFFLDYLTTALDPDELLTAVRVPKLGAGWSSHYEKFNRVAQAWSIVGVAALVRRDNGSIAEARIGLTNMGSTPLRAAAAEQALAGVAVAADAIASAAEHAAEGTSPPSDLSGQADYREQLVRVLTKRAVLAAVGS